MACSCRALYFADLSVREIGVLPRRRGHVRVYSRRPQSGGPSQEVVTGGLCRAQAACCESRILGEERCGSGLGRSPKFRSDVHRPSLRRQTIEWKSDSAFDQSGKRSEFLMDTQLRLIAAVVIVQLTS